MIIVGCPVKNDMACLSHMIRTLLNSTKVKYELVLVIGEGTNTECWNYLNNLKNTWDEVNVALRIENIQSKTPLEAYNYLFKIAKDSKSDLVLTQTDVGFPELYNRDWLKEMFMIAQYKNVGAVTVLNGGGRSGPDYIDGFEWLGGWCTYYPYKTIELIGGFDDNFPNGFGVDVDHSYRIYKANLDVIRLNYWVDHHLTNNREHDRNENTEQMKKASSEYFKRKWNL